MSRRKQVNYPQSTGLFALLLLMASPVARVMAQSDQVESLPVDGQQFREGQQFRFVCKATGNQDFAVRLICPLAGYANGMVASTACFENCGRPLCDQPNLNDCSKTLPELLNSNCSRSVRQVSLTAQEITVEYTFNSASMRHEGSYACQFKTMRSSIYIIITATTTKTTTTTITTSTSTTSATPTTSSTTSTTATSTSTTSSSTSSASATTVAKTTSGTSPTSSSAGAGVTGVSSHTTSGSTEARQSTRILTTTAEKLLTIPPESKTVATTTPKLGPEATQVPLKSGWFYGSIVGTVTAADIILICVLIFILTAWLIGFLCIRCQVLATRYRTGRPANACCSMLLCLGAQSAPGSQKQRQQQQHANGGLRKFAEQERKRSIPLIAMSLRSASADGLSTGQVYSEPADGSYYSPDGDIDDNGERPHLVLAGGGVGADDYYRLQQEFDDPLARAGFGTNPRSTFTPRDQTGRHSFQSARPPTRQRPGIPRELMLSGAPEEPEVAAEPSRQQQPVMTRDEFKRRMEDQKREIVSLRQQLRDSQLQLSQRAAAASGAVASQQDLRPSVDYDARQRQLPTSDDYEMLARASSDALPPSPPPPPPPPPSIFPQPTSPSRPLDDADLPPPSPPLPLPIVEEAAAAADERDGKDFARRSSLGEAYRTGQRY